MLIELLRGKEPTIIYELFLDGRQDGVIDNDILLGKTLRATMNDLDFVVAKDR